MTPECASLSSAPIFNDPPRYRRGASVYSPRAGLRCIPPLPLPPSRRLSRFEIESVERAQRGRQGVSSGIETPRKKRNGVADSRRNETLVNIIRSNPTARTRSIKAPIERPYLDVSPDLRRRLYTIRRENNQRGRKIAFVSVVSHRTIRLASPCASPKIVASEIDLPRAKRLARFPPSRETPRRGRCNEYRNTLSVISRGKKYPLPLPRQFFLLRTR